MLRRTSPYFFFYSWQTATLEKVQKEKNYTSPVWVEQSDLRWITQAVCPLTEGVSAEGGHHVNAIPIRLSLYNLNQFANLHDKKFENAITESDCPPDTVEHSSFSTKRAYAKGLQFQFEQRAVLHSLKGQESAAAGFQQQESEKKNVEKKDDAAEQQQSSDGETEEKKRLPTELFWITPREAFVRKFRPKSEDEEPFAVLTQGRKVVFNASQFVDPKALEKYPTDAATGRPLPSHHQAPCSSWLEAHLASLEGEQQQVYDNFGLFATKAQYEELGFKLKENAAAVVCEKYSPNFLDGKFKFIERLEAKKEEQKQQQQNDPAAAAVETKTGEAFGNDLSKMPRDSDVIHYSFIANQDALWDRSRIVRPDESQKQQQENKHIIVPQGYDCFSNMKPRLDAFLEKYPEQTKGIKLWVTRKTVKTAGYQVIEGEDKNENDDSKWVRSPLREENATRYTEEGKLDSQISSAKAKRKELEKMKVEYYHISQCEEPENVLTRVGMHTR